MIQNEARVIRKLCSLGGHNNIVMVFRQGEITNSAMYYIDMELCDGNLEQFIVQSYRHGGSIPISNIWTIALQIVQAMVFIHKQGEIHRDLKPRNSISLDVR